MVDRRCSVASRSLIITLALMAGGASAVHAEDTEDTESQKLLAQARKRAESGEFDAAVKLASQAIEADATNKDAFLLRGDIHAARRASEKAVADFTKALELDARDADLYDRRGGERFKLGKVKASIEDFDKAIEIDPRRMRQHWRRGISYYYAGQFKAGQEQFEAYQTFQDNDVENAVWRYLCMARRLGVEKARGDILRIRRDRRVPMMEVYDLYAGKLKPEDVLKAAAAGDPNPVVLNNRLFYAHLYLGLYYDAAGDKKGAAEHIDKAVEHKIGHYMWDVAKVHADVLKKK